MGVGGERHVPTALSPEKTHITYTIGYKYLYYSGSEYNFFVVTLNINRAEEIDGLLRCIFMSPRKKKTG